MKVLVIAPQPFFTPRGTPFSVYYRTRTMAELGLSIDLLTYGQGYDVEIPDVRIVRIPAFSILGRVRTGPSFLKLFLDVFIAFYTVGLLLRRRYDVVHAHEEGAFIARFLKPVFRFKLIYDMHSSLPEQLVNFSFTNSRLIKGVFSWLEKTTLRTSDAIVVICPTLALTAERVPEAQGKLMLIENSLFDAIPIQQVDRAGFDIEELERAKKRADDGCPMVVYTGTLEPYQGVDLLLEAFGRVARQRDDVTLLLVGGQADQVSNFRQKSALLGLHGRCFLTGAAPQVVAMECNKFATVLVSPRTSGTNTPLKIYAQLASRVPIVATRIESHTQILNDQVAFLVNPNADEFAAGILTALNQPDAARVKAENARRFYETEYSPDAYVGKTRRLLDLVRKST